MNNYLDTKEKRMQLKISYAVFVLNGMLALSVGSLLPFIREARALDYAFCGLLVSLHSCGNLIASFAAGTLPIGRKKCILIFNSFFALSFLLLIVGTGKISIALAFFLTGMARGASSNFNNTTINNLAPGQAGLINGLHAMFAIGAFSFPIILAVMTGKGAEYWVYACYFMLAMGILNWILYLINPVEEKKVRKAEKEKADFGFFKEPLFLLCTGTLFFYLCAEQGVIGWMITYFKDSGLMSASLSQMMASVLWIMILAGRLTAAWLSVRMKKEKLLVFMGIGFVLFFALLLVSRSTGLIILGIMGFGYSMAGIYPTTVSFAGLIIQKYKMAWSFMLTFASLGSILMPSVIGRIAEKAGIVYGMSSIVVVVLIDLVLIAALTRFTAKVKKED